MVGIMILCMLQRLYNDKKAGRYLFSFLRTISVSFGSIITEELCADLYGKLETLHTTGAIRIWSSTIPRNSGLIHVLGYGTNGGVDIMLAKGEPDKYSHTMGHQRPALYR